MPIISNAITTGMISIIQQVSNQSPMKYAYIDFNPQLTGLIETVVCYYLMNYCIKQATVSMKIMSRGEFKGAPVSPAGRLLSGALCITHLALFSAEFIPILIKLRNLQNNGSTDNLCPAIHNDFANLKA